ncbi:MAG: formylglycine-generating enzyme family protein [Deltaproteobacteria bacterium]|nr:MAG: formylglycine-generating enzyme family protein [Deltaproteobacteria bacterium]
MNPFFPPKTQDRRPKTLPLAILVLAICLCSLRPSFAQEVSTQGISFRLIPGGYYLLGSPLSEPGRYADEVVSHRVRVDSFYIAVTETTNAQYGRFLKATGHPAPLYWEDKNLNAPNQPVAGVTWHDAVAFTKWLTQVSGVPHRLPTEQEWEAAARGGLTGQPFPWGAEAPDAGGVFRANFRHDRTARDGFLLSAAVGSFPPNGYGLYDMAGNVAEWCLDRYHPLSSGGPFKPGILRVLKGGSWFSQARDLRCAARQAAAPDYADGYIGFRVVRLPSPAH